MLTSDLALSRQRGNQIRPCYIEAEDDGWLAAASALIELFREHRGCTRAALDAALEDYVGTGTDYKILRGLIKLLTDRTEFAAGVEVVPADLRRAVFLKARGAHPAVEESARAEVIEAASGELGCAPELVRANLYADLTKNQRLVEFEEIEARALVELYNVAQAQALLYRSVRMRLTIEPQGAEGYRELFGAIRAYRLIHTIRGSTASGYEIELDGPVSMFHRSQKYGVQMAVFLPALLLCKGWRMRAEIAQRPPHGTAFFEMQSEGHGLRSHYLMVTPYENPVREKLSNSWARFESEWTLSPSGEIINLGAGAFIPDFVLRHATGRQVYLEILGFWTPAHLKARLLEFAGSGFEDYLLAAWEELRGSREPLVSAPPHTIIFKRSLDPATLELTLNKLISED